MEASDWRCSSRPLLGEIFTVGLMMLLASKLNEMVLLTCQKHMPSCVCMFVTSQGAAGAAGSHLPAAEGEPGGAGGGDRGRHGGAAEALLPLRRHPSLRFLGRR